MTDHPILFSAPMVRALLEGRKTQTRRLAWQHPERQGCDHKWCPEYRKPTIWQSVRPGDRLWVRETWRTDNLRNRLKPSEIEPSAPLLFEADDPERQNTLKLWGIGRSAMYMPRWASRLTLIVTETRWQRVQDISEGDAQAAGCRSADFATGRECILEPDKGSYRLHFADLWNTLHGPDAWDRNDEVVALSFTVHQSNIDRMSEAA